MAWLSGWDYRKSHALTGATGGSANYQVAIKVYKSAGTDGTEVVDGITMGKIYVGTHCRDDFGDIRFTDDDGDTLLDYWMEESVSGSYAIFWVEVKDSLLNNQSIYVYYSKSDATSISSGADTFLFFDDFASAIDWVNKWQSNSQGSYSIDAGKLKLANADVTNSITTKNNYNGIAVSIRLKVGTVAPHQGLLWLSNVAKAWTNKDLDYIILTAGTNTSRFQLILNGSGTDFYFTPDYSAYYHHIYKLPASGNATWDVYLAGVQKAVKTAAPLYRTVYWQMVAYNGGTSWADDIYIRKYVNPEPAHSTWGDQEEPFNVVTNDATSITISSAILNATIDACEVRGFDWGTQSGVYTDEWYESGTFEQGTLAHPLSPLPQGTTYYFRAKAKQVSAGNWVYGSEHSFITLIRLSITSTPPTTIDITVNTVPQITPFTADYIKNSSVVVVITQSEPVMVDGVKHYFEEWEDASTNKTRIITITGTSTINAIASYRKTFVLIITSLAVGTEFNLDVGV